MYVPLAEQMRPQHIDDVIGQPLLLGEVDAQHTVQGSLRACLESGDVPSMILWGPPGTGKTTIARLVTQYIPKCEFVGLSAVSSGVADLKKIFVRAQDQRVHGIQSCVFIDEIHRFNKAQQDALLHYVEEGIIILIGATTENPSFEVNSALLSRMRVFVLEPLSMESLRSIFLRTQEKLNHIFEIEDDALESVLVQADGDARRLINIIEQLYSFNEHSNSSSKKTIRITKDILTQIRIHTPKRYDKTGDEHYNLISALHKSIRGSDCNAALYWLARMLEGGESPRYLARRLLRVAYEDIGLADPSAAQYVLTAWQTYERLGSPEGEIAIASAVIYLALSPKSNSSYNAYTHARHTVKSTNTLTPPKHILNAPTQLMKNLGYGKGYKYDHDVEDSFSGQDYFPEGMSREQYYLPVARGYEREMAKRLQYFNRKREELCRK